MILFSGHSLQTIHTTPMLKASEPSYWQGIVLFIIFSIYVLIRVSEPRKILKVFTSVFSLQESKQLFREEFKLTKRFLEDNRKKKQAFNCINIHEKQL